MKTQTQLLQEIEELKNKIGQLELEKSKAEERAEVSDHIREMFLTNIGHEIRTPMNGIIGMYNVLKQTDLTDEQREYLDIINISGQNLLSIIDDLIDLSKIETGQLKLDSTEFHLEEQIDQVLELLSIKAQGKGIRLVKQIDNSIKTHFIGDPARLRQILNNLIGNAIKYTREGSVNIKALITGEEEQFQELKIEVRDTGIGISEQNIRKLFKAFSQLDGSTTRKYGGTGLGLAISKSLANLMNGSIGVKSEEGTGSTFWIKIRFRKGRSLRQVKKQVITFDEQPNENLRILLVEDNLLNQKFALATLRKKGHRVDIAENGKVAVEKFRNSKYDLILMDIQMPVMDGIEATQTIRKIEKENNVKPPVKIIAITAYVMERDRSMCLNAGMNEYLAKPFKPQELIGLIKKVYYGKSAQTAGGY